MSDRFPACFGCPKLLRGAIFTPREMHFVFCFKVICFREFCQTS